MCGIVGVAGVLAGRSDATRSLLSTMSAMLEHRGPDSSGEWVERNGTVGFGHRRLSVIDLSEAGHQPMVLAGPRESAITYNGELYNHQELRKLLEDKGCRFASSSDTEVLLQACRELGVERTLDLARGMFAFAYWDGATQELWLARDRFGEKPLYYAIWDGGLAFASELKALRQVPRFPADLDPASIELLMRHSCIGGRRSIYRTARKVLPGTALRVAVGDRITQADVTELRYWDPVDEAAAAQQSPFRGDLDDAADALDELLGASVQGATISDVPLGAFLSGGIDSTSVVSQLVRRTGSTVRTYTIGYSETSMSEADDASRVARYLGTHHTELTVTPQDALSVIPRLPHLFDEPFADSSQIPTFLVSQLARRDVTVALSGDGGDELFGGYPRFHLADRMWRNLQRAPVRWRCGVANGLDRLPEPTVERLSRWVGRGPLGPVSGSPAERLHKTSSMLRATEIDDVYRHFVTAFAERSPLRAQVEVPPVVLPPAAGPLEQMMLRETMTYLPDDILTKVDRAAMGVSLETRVPFLTPEIFSFASGLPAEYRVGRSAEKVVVRHLLGRHVPHGLWDRQKQGFGIPLGEWLRGPLREWGSDLLAPRSLERHGLFDDGFVQHLWQEHQACRRNWGSRLWNLLSFQAWFEEWC